MTFDLTPPALAFCDARMRRTTKAGRARVFVGPNSASGLEATFELR